MGLSTHLHEIENLFLEECGFQLRPELCDALSLKDLLFNKLTSFITVSQKLKCTSN